MKAIVPLCLVSLLGAACISDEVVSEGAVSEDAASLSRRAPVLIQPGEDQILLAVTEDNYA
ncbi:MAG TPA: hypothetical protein VK427_07170, partial [Kofleriaceae bacterium]|nr:hypothetical protein [Kofleriaceae bacterium]